MITRRRLAAACGAALASSRLAGAQEPGRVYRIGWLGNSRPVTAEAQRISDAFVRELQRLGWFDGRNLAFERQYAEGDVARFPAIARELVAMKVDLIVATSANAVLAAKQATNSIAIVFASVPDPVEQGLVASLARPGGNVTGLSSQSTELDGKRLQLLKDVSARIARVAVLSIAPRASARMLGDAASLGIQLLPVIARKSEDIAAAVSAVAGADAWFIEDSTLYFAQRRTVVEHVTARRKPAIYPHIAYVEAGGLMTYAVDLADQFRRAAAFVDRILRGAKPADLPVEQPTKFEFAVNLATARSLALTNLQAILIRADRVIE